MRNITIKDIARELRISISTVSRALAGEKNVKASTREMVQETAKRMGYRPNPTATAMKSGHSNTIGVVVPEMLTPFAGKFIHGIQDFLYPHGIKVIVANSEESPERELANVEMMHNFMVDGIIISICSWQRNIEYYRKLMDEGQNIVFIDRIPQGIDAPMVVVDNYEKAYELVNHMVKSGRRRIAFIGSETGGDVDVYNSVIREQGYKDALKDNGMEYDEDLVVKAEKLRFENGKNAAEKLLDKDIDGVFAFTDTLALGAINKFQEKGLRVPEDIAVAGYSGTELALVPHPHLTTVEPPLRQMGEAAAELLLNNIRNKEKSNSTIVLEGKILLRESTGD